MNGLLLCEIYQPSKVELSIHTVLPEFASESKFCEYAPALMKICAEIGTALKPAARQTAQIRKNFFTRLRKQKQTSTTYRF